MKKIMKHGVLALTLLGGAALFAAPAVANSLNDEGDFGGGYRITVRGETGPERYDYVRHGTFRPYHYGPAYSYGYGPRWGGPAYYYGPGPGVGVGIGY